MGKRVLYISYDGMTDPLGQSQVLPYLLKLTEYGHVFDIISFEKPDLLLSKKNKIYALIKNKNITWHPLIYSNNPPILSTIKNLRSAKKLAQKLITKKQITIVHCRSYISALIGQWLQKKTDVKFIFDMRGWWADEKLEAGDWNGFIYKPIYNYFKKKEREFIANADAIVTLTQKGKKHISENFTKKNEVHVIPTCVNLDVFGEHNNSTRKNYRIKLNYIDTDLVMIYCGSIGGNYRSDLIFKLHENCFAKNQNTRLLLLTNSNVNPERLKNKSIQQVSCDYKEVSNYLMAADLGLIFYNDKFSSIGRCPTKLAEYWACDLPFATALNIADMPTLTEKHPEGGIMLTDFSEKEIDSIIMQMSNRKNLRHLAKKYFSLEIGTEQYNNIYGSL